MPETEHEHSGPHRPMIDTHQGLEPRIIAFYFLIAFLLFVLGGGLAYRQLLQTGQYDKSERQHRFGVGRGNRQPSAAGGK